MQSAAPFRSELTSHWEAISNLAHSCIGAAIKFTTKEKLD